jgi:hypothetical protein
MCHERGATTRPLTMSSFVTSDGIPCLDFSMSSGTPVVVSRTTQEKSRLWRSRQELGWLQRVE